MAKPRNNEFEGVHIEPNTAAVAVEPGQIDLNLRQGKIAGELEERVSRIVTKSTTASQGGSSGTFNRGSGTGKDVDTTSQ